MHSASQHPLGSQPIARLGRLAVATDASANVEYVHLAWCWRFEAFGQSYADISVRSAKVHYVLASSMVVAVLLYVLTR